MRKSLCYHHYLYVMFKEFLNYAAFDVIEGEEFFSVASRNTRRKLFNASVLHDLNTIQDAAKHINDIPIVIIGAGLAGLSAANHIIKHGFKSTIVLEATDRFGGRVNSKQFGDAFCELGAKFVSIDASEDSMYELLRHATGLQKKIQQKTDLHYVNTSGQKINRKIPLLVDQLFRQLCSGIKLEEKCKSGNWHDLNNVHAYFQVESGKLLKSMFREEEQAIANDIFTSLFKEFGSLLGCCLEYVNIEHIRKMRCTNASPIYIPTGLDNILNHITDNIAVGHMKTGKPVGEIRWFTSGTNRGTTITDPNAVGCLDGSLFKAEHIICTLPLGVLKNFSRFMFKPMLPKEKLQAIKNLGFGSPVKIYFEYERDLKPWFGVSLRPLWSEQERGRDRKWTKQIVEISKLPTSTRVLEISIGGAYYDEIEKLPDVEILKEVTKLLRVCLRNSKVPHPTAMLRSNWSTSACYLGGRPYFSTGSDVSDVTTLAAPLGEMPSLLFAGDATILEGFGTLDGARMSGIREAQRIIEYYNRRK